MLRLCLLIALFFSFNVYAASNSVEIDLGESSLEDKVSSLQSKLRIANNQNKNLHAKILELEERVRELNGKVQDLEHLDGKLTSKIQNLSADTNSRFESLEKKIVNTKSQEKSMDKVINPSMVKYLNMIEKKNYKGAVKGLEQYITANHTSPTLGEAYYWLGYAYMSDQEYSKAIKMFVNSYNGYPKGPKADYSLLNMAVSLYRVKEYNKACALIKKLINTSENKQVLRLAKLEQKDFNCKEPKVVKKSPVKKTPKK